MVDEDKLSVKVTRTKVYYDPKDAQQRGVYCIKEVEASGHIVYAKGYTICSKKDQFKKKVGRRIAEQRADKVVEWLKGETYHEHGEVYANLFYDFLNEKEYKAYLRALAEGKEIPSPRCGMGLLIDLGLNNLEKKLLGLDKPKPAAEEMPAEKCHKCGTKIKVDPNEDQEH